MITVLNRTKGTVILAHLNYADNSVVILHDFHASFRSLWFHHERNITLFKNICSLNRKGMQFHWKRSCRYNRNQRAVRAEYADVSIVSMESFEIYSKNHDIDKMEYIL